MGVRRRLLPTHAISQNSLSQAFLFSSPAFGGVDEEPTSPAHLYQTSALPRSLPTPRIQFIKTKQTVC